MRFQDRPQDSFFEEDIELWDELFQMPVYQKRPVLGPRRTCRLVARLTQDDHSWVNDDLAGIWLTLRHLLIVVLEFDVRLRYAIVEANCDGSE